MSRKNANIAALLVLLAGPLAAQATRTWVSGVGDDANPCSRTAPCKTFAGAISKTAAGGEINGLDPGGFGAVTITKAITIDGGGGTVAGVLVAGTDGIDVAAGSTDKVILRNLDINGSYTSGSTNGIRFESGLNLIIENCNIYGFHTRNISIESSTPDAEILISNSTVHDGLNNGIVVTPTGIGGRTTIDHVRAVNNANTGIVIAAGTAIVKDSVSNSNGVGMDAHGTSVTQVVGTSLADNQTGIQTFNSPVVRLSNVAIVDNAVDGYDIGGGTVYTFGNNQIAGNAIYVGSLTPLLQQ